MLGTTTERVDAPPAEARFDRTKRQYDLVRARRVVVVRLTSLVTCENTFASHPNRHSR